MIDIILLIGRLLFVVLLYLFLFAIMKTGIGLVRGSRKKEHVWTVAIEKGRGPVIVGRSPGSDIVIGAEYVSSRHARFVLMGQNLFIEDLGSTNGTAVNNHYISEPTALRNGDRITVGDVTMRVRFE